MTFRLTPMLEQYLGLKEEHPDALLFFRMGDFYELFFEDAETASRELQIALTSRNAGSEDAVPMCGVPHHASREYVRQLLEKGYKVAIGEQVEDPREAKGLVRREVVRVLTPGTMLETDADQAKQSHFLACLFWSEETGRGGLSWTDFSTGSWSGIALSRLDEAAQWISKLQPRELLFPSSLRLPSSLVDGPVHLTPLSPSPSFDLRRCRESLLAFHDIHSLTPLELEERAELLRACGALLAYLEQTQKQALPHLNAFSLLDLGNHLVVDGVTERNLEIFIRLDGKTGPGTLWHVVDRSMTSMGGRLLQHRLRYPFRSLRIIASEQDAVAHLFDRNDTRDALRDLLKRVYDLERLTTRITLNRCTPRDLAALAQSLRTLPELPALFTETEDLPRAFRDILSAWDDVSDLGDHLARALVDTPPVVVTEGGLFRIGYKPGLDELIEMTEHAQELLRNLLTREQEKYALPKLKLGYNRVFGSYFELPKSVDTPPPDHFIRRQTLAGGERYTTEELKTLEERLLTAADRRKHLEYELFQQLRLEVAAQAERLHAQARRIARLDLWQSFAQAAREWQWTRPVLNPGTELRLEQARHPAVEAVQGRAGYIPNNVFLGDQGRVLLITGPNMAGKSTILRQTALIVLLAQCGSYVPANTAEIGVVDRIFTRVGATDNLAHGHSTFMVEMTETARILRQCTTRSLVVMDEIGRGTATYDGLALAWAVVEDLADRGKSGVRTLFATHYHELTRLEDELPAVRNFTVAVKEWQGEIVFLRRLIPGPADRSYGVEVARLAGVPARVVTRARELLSLLESRHDTRSPTQTLQRQSIFPGLVPKPASSTDQEREVLDRLRRTDVLRLTPLEAQRLVSELTTLLEQHE